MCRFERAACLFGMKGRMHLKSAPPSIYLPGLQDRRHGVPGGGPAARPERRRRHSQVVRRVQDRLQAPGKFQNISHAFIYKDEKKSF